MHTSNVIYLHKCHVVEVKEIVILVLAKQYAFIDILYQ